VREPPTLFAEMKTWSAEQLPAFPISARDDRVHALWHTPAMTAMRRGEELGLLWDDVDNERRPRQPWAA